VAPIARAYDVEHAVGYELLDSLDVIDLELEPRGLPGSPLDPRVIERQSTGAPTIDQLDFNK
jgi:hypothetical protein